MSMSKICPRCHSADTARSRRRFYERLVPGTTAFRCDECKHRFLIVRALNQGVRHG
jgi:hypothetical protein